MEMLSPEIQEALTISGRAVVPVVEALEPNSPIR